MRKRGDGIVYSTEGGRMCPVCGRRAADCECRRDSSTLPDGGDVRVYRETRRGKGKTVTVITGLPLPLPRLKELARRIKTKFGAGGAVQEGAIVIQGDHVEKIIEELGKLGWPPGRRGGSP